MLGRVLVANRGEIALRIIRTTADLGMSTVAVASEDDRAGAHAAAADRCVELPGVGPAAYLDEHHLVRVAEANACDAVHPGYGLLSERASFARACEQAGLVFVGPTSQTLATWADKRTALERASALFVPTLPRSSVLPDAAAAAEFMVEAGGPIILKATNGGGGRGLRIVESPDAVEAAFRACRTEAERSFGVGDVYAERLLSAARHIEVQIIGDGTQVIDLGERDCSLQRRRQKIVEVAPAPGLDPKIKGAVVEAARRLAAATQFRGLGTFEFLVGADGEWFFIECNPRLQVEHTVTEEVFGLDLVALQLEIAGGASLKALGLSPAPTPRGMAIQMRVLGEVHQADGQVRPSEGTLQTIERPSGPGVRVDDAATVGAPVNPRFDALLAKVVVRVPRADWSVALRRARRALAELTVGGLETNRDDLLDLLSDPAVDRWAISTRFVDDRPARPRSAVSAEADDNAPEVVVAPLRGEVVSVLVASGDQVQRGQELVILEALKMHHAVTAPAAGEVLEVDASIAKVAATGERLVLLRLAEGEADEGPTAEARDLDEIRPDLARLRERLATTLDEARPKAVTKRHTRGFRTARENVSDLCDEGSFQEYGQLTVAAQRRVRSMEDLIASTPADGLIAGFATVNAELYGPEAARCAVLAYDYTVLAGTQGMMNHKKTDRVLDLAREWRVPVAFFCEGGGGRPSDTDLLDIVASTLDVQTFATYAAGSGGAPRIGIVAGPCFAGNAVLFGSSDITIATRQSFIGMAGPAMIEAGGLGACRVEDVGPIEVQSTNGVVDLVADDEPDAVRLTRQVLGYFQGRTTEWACGDQRALRHAVPQNRKRVYDVRPVIDLIADAGTFLELRRRYGAGMITGFARIEGRPVGVIANDPKVLSGAIDAEGAEKAARFMLLCDAFGLPILSLCDTPGFMVGPEHERAATVRRASRMLVVAANLQVPLVMVCLRKGYGLGAQAMAGGSFWCPAMNVSWPSGEFGPMGLEGAVQLAFRKKLEAAPDEAARKALFDREVGRLYDVGKAVSTASMLEIDAVIDPVETRSVVMRALTTFRRSEAPRARFVDVW